MTEKFLQLKEINAKLAKRVETALEGTLPAKVLDGITETLDLNSQKELLAGLQAIATELKNLPVGTGSFTHWAQERLGLPSDQSIRDSAELRRMLDQLGSEIDGIIGEDVTEGMGLLERVDQAAKVFKGEAQGEVERISSDARKILYSLGIVLSPEDRASFERELANINRNTTHKMDEIPYPLLELKSKLENLKEELRHIFAHILLEFKLDGESVRQILIKKKKYLKRLKILSLFSAVGGAGVAAATGHPEMIGLPVVIAAIAGFVGTSYSTELEETAKRLGSALEGRIQAQLTGGEESPQLEAGSGTPKLMDKTTTD